MAPAPSVGARSNPDEPVTLAVVHEGRQRLNSGIGVGSTQRTARTLVNREQEQIHGTVADKATVFDPVLDRLPEMEPDQDA